MKAEQIKVKLRGEITGHTVLWEGYLFVDENPVLHLSGEQIDTIGRMSVPLSYPDPKNQYGKSTLMWLGFNPGYSIATGVLTTLGLDVPVKGWVADRVDHFIVTLKPDTEDSKGKDGKIFQCAVNYRQEMVDKKETNKKGEPYVPFVLESDKVITPDQFARLRASFTKFDEWEAKSTKKEVEMEGDVSLLEEIAF